MNTTKNTPEVPRYKLVLVTLNGKTIMSHVPVDSDGKARIDLYKAMDAIGIPKGGCVWIG